MVWQCKKCGEWQCTPADDTEFWRRRDWRCWNCFAPIADGEVTAEEVTVAVATSAGALGDYLVCRHLVDWLRYQKKRVRVVEYDPRFTIDTLLMRYPADTVLVMQVVSYIGDQWADPRIMLINPHADGWRLVREKGFLPKCPWRPKPVDVPEKYIAIHLRKVDKCWWKNVTQEEAEAIGAAVNGDVVLIGNDDAMDFHTRARVHDMRNKLSIREVSYVLSRASAFIGKDSGIAHLAACFRIPMVAWGYDLATWFPRQRPDLGAFFLADAPFGDVLKAIRAIQ